MISIPIVVAVEKESTGGSPSIGCDKNMAGIIIDEVAVIQTVEVTVFIKLI